ncbi:hypothetical protein HUT18_08975 [Streptomyces sp. NA04227]|uniref:hypothetical protein n=1 Tax=Streptomyces sp. NA04227 TaxID=2742136 RepID=UPI001591C7C8|nr:hypothetical protein [Streptomyces sp. NA04227]QKW06516.1 hypothetical protein HUT18_08975 [Streptomyces sp. NA04227]
MPEFTFTPLTDQEDVSDGMFLGHLDVNGSSGSATTRSARQPDGGMGIVLFPALVELLDGVGTLLRDGGGKFKCSDIGLPLKFTLKNEVLTTGQGWSRIDESAPGIVADSLWSAARSLVDSHLGRVTRPTEHAGVLADGGIEVIDFRTQVKDAMDRFEDTRRHFGR